MQTAHFEDSSKQLQLAQNDIQKRGTGSSTAFSTASLVAQSPGLWLAAQPFFSPLFLFLPRSK